MPVLTRCKVVLVAIISLPLLASGQPPNRVMPGTINFDPADSIVKGASIDAALALSLELTGSFAYITVSKRDSVLATQNGGQHTIISAANSLGATHIAFLTVSRIVNLIRSEIVLASGSEFSTRVTGIGYASIRFKEENTGKPIAEPAILTAVQRAIANALDNRVLYNDVDSSVRTYPTVLLSIGGVEFLPPPDDLPPWQLNKERTVASYDIAQSIVGELKNSRKFTVVDIDTRDTMYATAGFHLVANDRSASPTEIQILRMFEVSHLIVGTLERTARGARLTLMLCIINNNDTYTSLRSAESEIVEDTKAALRTAIAQCVRELNVDD